MTQVLPKEARAADAPRSDRSWKDRLLATSPMTWVLSGFFVSYVLFFLLPVFFSGRNMLLTMVVPVMSHLGSDLDQTLLAAHRLFDLGRTPYVGSMLFPPLTYLLFRPLEFAPGMLPYWILSALTVLAYATATVLFPLLVSRERVLAPPLVLIAATGAMSYGLQFELERGQFNVIAVCLAYLAIWLFHSRPSRQVWAYALFSLSVQLKLYPLVFMLMLVRDWKDWRNNLRRFVLLLLANVALTFCLGPAVFSDFVKTVWLDQAGPEMVGFVNHSIHSFISLVVVDTARTGPSWMGQYAGTAAIALYAIVGLCLLLIIFKAARWGPDGVNADLLLVCAVAALLVPGESNDYKLTILAGPVAIFLCSLGQRPRPRTGSISWLLALLLFSFAYSSTLFSFTYKPSLLVLEDLFPALLLMLLTATFLALRSPPFSPAPHGVSAPS